MSVDIGTTLKSDTSADQPPDDAEEGCTIRLESGNVAERSLFAIAFFDMTPPVLQHAWLWLLALFLTGFLSHWVLELFFFRQRLFDAESRLRRRGEELDSERFAHGRTSVESKARLDALQGAQREISELIRAREEERKQSIVAQKAIADLQAQLLSTQSNLELTQAELERTREACAIARKEVEEGVQTREEARTAAERATSALAHVRADVAALEGKLKARGEEIRQTNEQWGAAREEASELKEQLAQSSARLTAAQQTRKALEKELQSREQEVVELREREADLEAELKATSASHEALETELAKWTAHSAPSEGTGGQPGEADRLLKELEDVTLERNRLAAELAALGAE